MAPVVIAENSPLKFAKALSIIVEENGLAVDNLTNSTVFTNISVNSLLGLTISARFKEELNIDHNFNALFYEHLIVGNLKAALGNPSASITGVL
jgi:hypothetical protein